VIRKIVAEVLQASTVDLEDGNVMVNA
jgi:hypothetical protein